MRAGQLMAFVSLCACGPDLTGGFSLSARAGSHTDGSGSASLALLTLISDRAGKSTSDAWSGEVLDSAGMSLAKFTHGDGSATWWSAVTWPAVPLPRGEKLKVRARDLNGHELTTDVSVLATAGLDSPGPHLSATGAAVEWSLVEAALSYRCAFSSSAGNHSSTLSRTASCAVDALPDGAWQTTVTAYTADLLALTDASDAKPVLPESFDMAEASFVWTRGATQSQLRAATGVLYYSATGRGLAVQLSILGVDGQPSPLAWDVTVDGPGLATGSLHVAMKAGVGRALAWSYDVSPRDGATYLVQATSSDEKLALSVPLSMAPGLTEPAVAASPQGVGGADVTWAPVPAASSYFVSIWDATSGAYLDGKWTATAATTFAPGTFVSGARCNVYVAATNADMIGGGAPGALTVSENTYSPASFTVR